MPTNEEIYECCPECGEVMDMRGIHPFTRVACSACGVEFTARATIDRYLILEQLAEGGTASVYRALETKLDRVVALKIIKDDGDSSTMENHERQARLIAAVEHPSIVRIFDFGRAQGLFYLAMEFLSGGSLDDLIQERGSLDEATVLGMGIEVAEGLGATLEKRLIHRDIKPANILFTDSRAVRVVDFGLSAQPLGEIWGTPNYIAPEKLHEQPEDFRSDLYSLGATLFHALAGHPPYETENVPLEALRSLKSQPVDLRAVAPWLGEEVVETIARMMSVDPAKRHGSYGELIVDLRHALEMAQRPAH